MSASEKLKALSAEFPSKRWDAMDTALPQIVAVVEAAENLEPWLPTSRSVVRERTERVRALRGALTTLDEALDVSR